MGRPIDTVAAGPAMHLRGVVLPEGVERDVFVDGGRITFREPEDATTVFSGGYLLPGLVDAHAHLGLASPGSPGSSPAELARASARAHLAVGVLAIREPGGPNRASAGIGPGEGLPRTFTGGQFLAPPGAYVPGLAREVTDDELPDAAEEEARASGAWAKVVGDRVGPDGRLRPTYRRDVLGEAVRRVHAVGARVAVHTVSPEGIEAAIEAGVDSIEHGYGLTDELIRAMAAAGVAFVPTLVIAAEVSGFVAFLGAVPGEVHEAASASRRHPEMVRRAAEAGVLVLAGTDAGLSPHGIIRREVQALIGAGLSAELALAGASWTARRFLGLPGIEEGAPADLVAFGDDPRTDVDALDRPSLVILDGNRC